MEVFTLQKNVKNVNTSSDFQKRSRNQKKTHSVNAVLKPTLVMCGRIPQYYLACGTLRFI